MTTDKHILASLEKCHEPYVIFDGYYHGAVWSATVLQEQGVVALPQSTPYVASDYCADMLRHINHPFALILLMRVARHTKRCHNRMMKACAAFPHTALVALAELLVQREENSWRIMLIAILISQPALAEQVIPWLSTPAVAVLKSCQQQLTQSSNHTSADLLSAIVVSPSWLSKKKKSPIPVLDLAPLNLESIYTITDTEAKEFQTHWDWEPREPGEGAKNFLYSLGCCRWDFGTHKYTDASDLTVGAWEREDLATLIQMFRAHHASYQGE